MDIEELEEAARIAWPALQDHQSATGTLRFAAGVSRRANSMNPYLHVAGSPAAVQWESEQFYRPRKLPSIVKVLSDVATLPRDFAALDAHLARQQYVTQAPTQVMVSRLDVPDAMLVNPGKRFGILEVELGSWLRAWHKVRDFPAAHLATHKKMLARTKDGVRYLLLLDNTGHVISTGMSVMTGTALGIYGVATEPAFRRLGCSSYLLSTLLTKGRENGARYSYLQVERENRVAVRLYRKLGFASHYLYWYRVKPFSLIAQ